MKRILLTLLFISTLSLQAQAGSVTVKYDVDDGSAETWTYHEDTGTFTGPDGITGNFTLNEETKTLCGTVGEAELCATFDEITREVGGSTGFTTSDGRSGTATVVTVE